MMDYFGIFIDVALLALIGKNYKKQDRVTKVLFWILLVVVVVYAVILLKENLR